MNATPIPLLPDDWETISLSLKLLQAQYLNKADLRAAVVLGHIRNKVDSHITAAKPEESTP